MEILVRKAEKVKVANSKEIWLVMRQILRRENKLLKEQEHFWIVGLDKQNRILFIELMGLGGKTFAPFSVKTALKMAIYKDAHSIIAVHNHPSGILVPSGADKELTQYLKHGAHFVEIPLKDHLIISEKGYYSFKEKKTL